MTELEKFKQAHVCIPKDEVPEPLARAIVQAGETVEVSSFPISTAPIMFDQGRFFIINEAATLLVKYSEEGKRDGIS